MLATKLPLADEPRHERCETCRFWADPSPQDDSSSECRRMPPPPNFAYLATYASYADDEDDACERTGIRNFGVWPRTSVTDWCGEWQAKAKGI